MLEKEESNYFLADYNWDCNDDDGSFFYRDPTTEWCVVVVNENVGVNYTVRSCSYWTTREDEIAKSNFAARS